jgi:hypothetical protein
LQRSTQRSTTRWRCSENYDDPDHPVVRAAERRIEQLAAEKKVAEKELRGIETEKQSAAALEPAERARQLQR